MARARSKERTDANERLGAAIAARRRAVGLSQKQLAERIGIHEVTLSEWERGLRAPNASKLARVAHALGLVLAELLAIADNRLPVGNLLLEMMKVGDAAVDFVTPLKGEDDTARAVFGLPGDAYRLREQMLEDLSRDGADRDELNFFRHLLSGPSIRRTLREAEGTPPTDKRVIERMRTVVKRIRPRDSEL